jgi:hypothetical protein
MLSLSVVISYRYVSVTCYVCIFILSYSNKQISCEIFQIVAFYATLDVSMDTQF